MDHPSKDVEEELHKGERKKKKKKVGEGWKELSFGDDSSIGHFFVTLFVMDW